MLVGSSPRGRGTPATSASWWCIRRVIPAWAGNTKATRTIGCWDSGHPRVGGEHPVQGSPTPTSTGSSPRGRGTLRQRGDPAAGRRVIPAWAGNTSAVDRLVAVRAGHPRVGGEHTYAREEVRIMDGSSPRGRGTPRRVRRVRPERRVIPAWAGNTGMRPCAPAEIPGHPRVGGEHCTSTRCATARSGSSPRGRGTHHCRIPARRLARVIPAWAGNTREPPSSRRLCPGHPRVGGEHDKDLPPSVTLTGSSPRGRGTLQCPARRQGGMRVIPAWAGNTIAFFSA